MKQSENYDYSAKSVVDGNASTSWQENEEGTGEGKGIKLSLDGIHKIRYMVLYLGCLLYTSGYFSCDLSVSFS